MSTRHRWLAGLAAILMLVVAAGTALGYAGEVAASVTVTRPSGTLKCGVDLTVSASIFDAAGKPISEQPVAWSFTSTPSSADRIKTTDTVTNSSGTARTTVVLACVPGSRSIRAQADEVSGSAVLNVTAAGLPNTSTLPGRAPAPQDLAAFGTLLAALALAAGGALVVRRIGLARR